MDWFNYYGLAIMAVIMIPNIIYAVKHKNQVVVYDNKAAIIFEQIARYGCFAFMIFNIPYTYIGFWFSFGKIFYITVNAVLLLGYCISWSVLRNKNGIVKALLLSIIPSSVFIVSSILIASILLFVFAVIFAVTHILISIKSAKAENTDEPKIKKKTIISVIAVLLSVALIFVGTLGGLLVYQKSNFGKLKNMSSLDMIEYCCSDKNTKISVAFIENGEITYHIYSQNGEETNIYDYEIGSISKTFVGALCAKAINENKLSLTDSIAKYLDLGNDKYYPTIERLLTHTSGYAAYYFESSMIGNKFAHITNDFYGIGKDKVLHRVQNIVLENKDYPFVYSNFGISVLGLVLESIYNDSFTNIMNDFIRNDLHLQNTQAAKQNGNLNKYWKWKQNDGYIPAGSIISNIESMAIYLQLYMNNTISYLPMTYSKIKDINANQAAYEAMNIRMDSVGMTWMLDNKNDIIWHNGATTDFNSYIGFTQDRQRGVVILSNLNANDKISMTVIGAKLLTEQFDL